MSKTIAVEVARRGITVNAVAPGFVETKLTEGIGEEMRSAIPARRTGEPEEVAACVRFLASPRSVVCDRHDPDRRRRPQRLITQSEQTEQATEKE